MSQKGCWYRLLALICVAAVVLVAVLVTRSAPSAHTLVREKFIPPSGQALFIMGQDVDSIETYSDTVGPTPGGVTGETSLQNLEGITSDADSGAGRNNLDKLANDYPDSVIVLGLYLVNYLPMINSGEADGHIDWLLNHLKRYNRPVFLRFGHEFDGAWNHYNPSDYKTAWIHFYNRMIQDGVTNVALVWQGAAYCGETYNGNDISAWYPGDKYVDWVGLSYFTPQDCNTLSVNTIVSFAKAHGKPVLICESTPQRYDLTNLTYSPDLVGSKRIPKTALQIWNEWFAPFFAYIYAHADVIRGMAYISADWDAQSYWGPPYVNGYWGDSRVQANATIRNLWLNEINTSYWLKGSPSLFATLLGLDEAQGIWNPPIN